MTVHPVLESLSTLISLQFLDDHAAVYCSINKRRELHTITVCVSEQNEDIELNYSLTLRCTLDTQRTKLYIKALQEQLNANLRLSELPLDDLRIDELHENGHVKVEGSVLLEEGTYPDGSIDDIVEYVVSQIYMTNLFFETFAMIARICYRLQTRDGTPQYKKLLPKNLAALTFCGMNSEAIMH